MITADTKYSNEATTCPPKTPSNLPNKEEKATASTIIPM